MAEQKLAAARKAERTLKKARIEKPVSKKSVPSSPQKVAKSKTTVSFSPKDKGKQKATHRDAPKQSSSPALPSSFVIVAGSYEKLLYGLDGTVTSSEIGYEFHLKPIFIFPAHVSSIKAVAASPNGGKWLATGSSDEIIKVWDLARRKEIGGLMQHQGSITHLQFPSRSHLLSASEDGTLSLFHARDWTVLRSLKGHKGRVNSVAVHPSGKVALSVGQDKTLRMWDLMRGKGSASTKLGKEGEVVRWTSSGTMFVVQSLSSLDVFATDMTLRHTITHPSRIHNLHFCKRVNGEGEILLVAAEDKKVSVYQVSEDPQSPPTIIAEMIGHSNRVKAVETLPIALPKIASVEDARETTTIACTISSDGKIFVYDLAALPVKTEEIIQLRPVAEYDSNGTRLTCLTVAEGRSTGVLTAVSGKRKEREEDTDNEDEGELVPQVEVDELGPHSHTLARPIMNASKLKRKLGDLGVDTSSKRASENFCLIGTPLPPLEKSKDTGEFVPLWKQEVRDEKGRRRLHGAFTGGFSAGYFNTVGSKEGWTPSTFVSSRSDRAKARTVKPEDFMDDEDLAELRADQKLVSELDEMDIVGGTQAEKVRKTAVDDNQKDPMTLALEQAMMPAPKDSLGGRILKKMGWRPGQGIGPRVTWRQREIQHGRDPDRTGADVDEEAKKHMYAPKDMTPIVVPRKDDFHGVGYNKSLSLHASLGIHGQETQAAQGPRLAGGFGLGTLNDADEDDLDVYDHTVGHGRSRHAFDASDIHEEEHIVSGSKTRGTALPTQPRQTNTPALFRDGKPVLPGFRLSEKPVTEDMWFPMPEVPKGWKPNPKNLWERTKTTPSGEDKENVSHFPARGEPQTHTQWKTGISADQRGVALGETPLPLAPRSIFEYMSKKDQERIKNITASRFTGPSTTDTTAQEPITTPFEEPYIPHTEVHIAQAALQGFQPFTSNPNKQSRYTTYLRAHAEPGAGISIPAQQPTQTPEMYAREMNEFAKAAALYRPVSGAMAGRFTSAAVLELGPKIVEGLHTPSVDPAPPEEESGPSTEEREEKKEEDPKVHAARLGMYGPMTREVVPWQPARLLCKRFGVKDPNPDIHFDTGEASTSAHADVSQSTDVTGGVGGEPGSGEVAEQPTAGSQSAGGKRDLANIGLGDDDGQGNDILTYERPPMSIFKAIFASDDEESEDEKEDTLPEDQATEVAVPLQPSTSSHAVEKVPEKNVRVPPPAATDHAQATAATNDKVDLSTFKPTFVPRDAQSHSHSGNGNEKAPGTKEKKIKRSKGGPLVSFDVDEDGAESLSILARRETKDRDRPKKKRKKHKEQVEEVEVWVEKPPPDIVKDLPRETPKVDDVMKTDGTEGVAGPPRGRKRAVDFL